MSSDRRLSLSRYLGLTLVAASILALEVIFTRIFSIMIWYHFAYLVIGVAMLGGSAAGAFLTLRQWNTQTLTRRLGNLAIGFSLCTVVSLLVIGRVQFDPLGGRAALPQTILGLAIYFSLLFITFFLGGLTISGAFTVWSKAANRLYFADLLGASLGVLTVVWLIQALTGPGAMLLAALLSLVGGWLLGVEPPKRARWLFPAVSLGQVGLCIVLAFVAPVQLPAPPSKELGWAARTLNIRQPEYTVWNPVARVDVLPPTEFNATTDWIVFGGLSSTSKETAQPHSIRLVTLDGTSATALHEFNGDLARFRFLDQTVLSAAYQVGRERPTVLNIGVGGGLDILLARLYNAEHITAIELNSDVVALLKERYVDFSGRLVDDPRTTLIAAEGRSYLVRNEAQYDIIQGIGVDNFAALSGGAYVLSESYLYTVEAFDQAFRHLTPQGLFSWTRQVNDPPRETLRLTGVAAEALRGQGVTQPGRHIAIVANETNTVATLLVSRSPFSQTAIQKLRVWAAANQFNLLQDPLERLNTPYADYLNAADPRAFEAAYPFNIFPVTDNNPFFYNYFKWTNLRSNRQDTGDVNTILPIGNLILLAMLGFTVIAGFVFIAAPLWRYQRRGLATRYVFPMLVYFSALGVGYIFIEIVLIQRFTLFIGYPTHAITTTIFSMLFFSAIGSLIAPRVVQTLRHLQLISAAIAGLTLISIVTLPRLFQVLLRLPDRGRILVSVVLIAPLALLMGMPFPTGLRWLGQRASALVPWAWGMNGLCSVLGSVLVILVSMQTSFTVALAGAALIYLIAAGASSGLGRVDVTEAERPRELAPATTL